MNGEVHFSVAYVYLIPFDPPSTLAMGTFPYIVLSMKQQEALLARDIIQMIREYKDDANVLEYLEGFSASIARLVDSTAVVNWDDIAGICDQRYFSINKGEPLDLNNKLLDQCERAISELLPVSNS